MFFFSLPPGPLLEGKGYVKTIMLSCTAGLLSSNQVNEERNHTFSVLQVQLTLNLDQGAGQAKQRPRSMVLSLFKE